MLQSRVLSSSGGAVTSEEECSPAEGLLEQRRAAPGRPGPVTRARFDPQRAVIDPAKLRDYVLSPAHPVGRFKAVFFAALGYLRDEWPTLADDLRTQHLAQQAERVETNAFGTKYRIVAPLTGPPSPTAAVASLCILP